MASDPAESQRTLGHVHLLILDDWGLEPLNEQARHDLLEILEDRYGRRSTIITSQLPVSAWHEIIGNPTHTRPPRSQCPPHRPIWGKLTAKSASEILTRYANQLKTIRASRTPASRGRDHPGIRGRNHLGTNGRLYRNRHSWRCFRYSAPQAPALLRSSPCACCRARLEPEMGDWHKSAHVYSHQNAALFHHGYRNSSHGVPVAGRIVPYLLAAPSTGRRGVYPPPVPTTR